MLQITQVEFKRTPVNLILSHENLPEDVPYYCIRCRSFIFKVNRDTTAVWMGEGYPQREIPKGMGWVHFFCHGCKRDYNFYFS